MDKISKIQNYDTKKMKKYCSKADLKDLHTLKLYLDDLYYNTSDPELSDVLYDILKDSLMKRDPEYVPPVGAKIRKNANRVKIPYFMGSADKITPSEPRELERWILKNPCDELALSEKLDGVSGTFTVVDGKRKLFTRGDGEIGADISYLIQYIDSIPHVKEDIAVRGELIIRKDVFEKKYYFDGKRDDYKTDKAKGRGYGRLYRNARNMVAGLVGAKTVRSGLQDIEFVVYEIVGHSTMSKPSDQMKMLKKLGFVPAMNEVIHVPENMDEWIDLHNRYKKKSVYEIDGIVLQSNIPYDRNPSGNPSYLFAFKVNSEDDIHETTVLDIEWSVSSWGQIVPVAIIDPVELPGNTIKRVTVSNAGLMREKGIGPGAIINVTRSKEVIPFIVSVSEPCEEFKWPDIDYVWDDNEVHLKVVDASPEIIAKMRVKLFSKFFAKMGIKHVSSATITKMYDHGFDTLLKIISAKKEELVYIDGIQEKSAERIVSNIKEGLKGVKSPELMGSCGVFGFGVGRKRVIALMTDIPDLLTRKRKGLKKRVLEVEGFSEIMADKVIDNIDYAVQFIDEISKYVSFLEDTRVSDTLVGLKFVFSGFRSKELEQNIEDRGGKMSTSVSNKTSGMVVAKSCKATGKVTKAQSLGIPVYTKEEFIEKFIS
jgi:DNA ligase (NAD+)